MKRSCDGCTKCCEGYLVGEAEGHKFYPGMPCHFVKMGKGCAIYANRPKDPCVEYKCLWVQSDDIPEWAKPSEIKAIIDERKTDSGIGYLKVTEAGAILDSRLLSWVFEYALNKGLNLMWTVEGGFHYIGSTEFVQEMTTKK